MRVLDEPCPTEENQVKRTLLASVLALVVLAGLSACETRRPSGAPSGRTPVIFVHGWNADEGKWDDAVAEFKSAGYTSGDITVLYYDSSKGAADVASSLADEVDHLRTYTGQQKVDIVSHSYGSMVTKSCIVAGRCAGKVSHWMSLAGADNGTSTAELCTLIQASCRDMTGQTSTIADLQAAWGQISVQNVKVEVQWSSSDGVITPNTNSKLPPPAVNLQVSGSLSHDDMVKNSSVITETINFFKR